MNNIDSFEILKSIEKANKLTLKHHSNEITLERAIFLSWWCDKGDCKFCYMSTQKDRIKESSKAKRQVNNIYAEAEMCARLGWNIEFLSGGYESFTTLEIKDIAQNIKNITGKGVWLNTGITNELDQFGDEIIGITGALEVANPKLHDEICPSKPIDKISEMLSSAGDLGYKKAITIILGLGETLDDLDYLIDYIKLNKIDRIIFYSLNPHEGTEFENESQPASLYYSQVVSTIRLNFPKIEIICGTWIDNLANIGILILSGANGITKFPLFKMFASRYGKRVEQEVKWTGRSLKGTFTDIEKLGKEESEINNEYTDFIKRYIKKSKKI
ncbi:radical SAM protein [Methanobrevibacter sp. DSM 116169]|uniref:radical SAM protein n=1 Tax=Methanobrevibacter sp. DSM 116169 TaxID=3242727 RepID=UPI0038FCC566